MFAWKFTLVTGLSCVAAIADGWPHVPGLDRRASAPAAFASSADRSLNLSSYTAPVIGASNPGIATTWTLSVDDTSTGHKQSITGFGAAITDATVQTFNTLPASQRSSLLQGLFSPTTGLGFSLMRNTIASSDLSPTAYTFDDTANGAPDTSLAGFNLGASGTAMAGLIKQMKAIAPNMKLLSTPWSPPGWIKNNKKLTGGSITTNTLNHAYVDSWAQYFVKYINAFSQLGVPVDFVTIQNEPLNDKSGMPTMNVTADEATGLIQNNLGPALASAAPNVQIWAWDLNTDKSYYPQTVIDGASQYTNTVAWHCYKVTSRVDYGVLSDFHSANPGVAQYMTECYTSNTTGWSQAADFTMGPLLNWASGAIAWTLGTDTNYGPHLDSTAACSTCRGLVVVDTDAGTYEPQVDYYMMGQFSKFMPRGATILSTTGGSTTSGGGVSGIASLNPDGTRTVVIENPKTSSVFVTVKMKSGQSWSAPVYQKSLTTWLLPSA